jgi:hypothetical protein
MTLQTNPLLLKGRTKRYTLVIHGGAGTITKEHTTPEQHAAYKRALSQALLAVSTCLCLELQIT